MTNSNGEYYRNKIMSICGKCPKIAAVISKRNIFLGITQPVTALETILFNGLNGSPDVNTIENVKPQLREAGIKEYTSANLLTLIERIQSERDQISNTHIFNSCDIFLSWIIEF